MGDCVLELAYLLKIFCCLGVLKDRSFCCLGVFEDRPNIESWVSEEGETPIPLGELPYELPDFEAMSPKTPDIFKFWVMGLATGE